MKLGDWITKEKMTRAQFGARIGKTSASVSRYVTGQRHPAPGVMKRITEATNGEVTANDFMDTAAGGPAVANRRNVATVVAS